jgi:hypothetical protein
VPGVPSFKIDLSSLDAEQRRPRWQALMSTHRIDAMEDAAPPPRAAGIVSWLLGQIALGS